MSGRDKGAKRHRGVNYDYVQGITKPAIKKLNYRAGVRQVSGLVYEEIRGVLKVWLEDILRNSVTVAEHDRKKTVDIKHVAAAFQAKGISLVAGVNGLKTIKGITKPRKVTDEVKKPRRSKPGTRALRQIRKMQKYSDRLIIPQLPFSRLVREVGQDFKTQLRFAKEAVLALQLAAEEYLVGILRDSLEVALVTKGGRGTVMPKHIQAVRTIREERY